MTKQTSSRVRGVGQVLVAVYAIMALGATARSIVQILTKFATAPVAYSLSALAAVVYIIATVALIRPGAAWYRVAWITLSFELLGVVTVGALTVFDSTLFPSDTVWSYFGRGYVFIPLVLPVLGMIWLSRNRPADRER
jgi:hypothetical protein